MAAKASKTAFKTWFNKFHFYTHLPGYLSQHLKLRAAFLPSSGSKHFQTLLAPGSPVIHYTANTEY